MYRLFFKRILDIIFSMIGLIVLSPLLLIMIVILHYSNKGASAFFLQERPGKNENIFRVIKFKTMTDERNNEGILLPDEKRLTKIGKFARSTSIDELPQLLNVLKGEMSLIGPRPLMISYLPLYSEIQIHRHDVRPGITGWAQINGRNALSWKRKFELDVWYVKNLSFLLDLKILILTIVKVFRRENINLSTEITAVPFDGNN